MIHSFTAKNFYSIGSKISVDLTSKSTNPGLSELYADESTGKKVSRIGLIGGANASGKTNILRVLAFLRHFITDPIEKKQALFIKHAFLMKEDTELSVSFSIDKSGIYTYSVVFGDNNIIRSEQMTLYSRVEKRHSEKKIFIREYVEKDKKYKLKMDSSLKSISSRSDIIDILSSSPAISLVALCSGYDSSTGHLRKARAFWEDMHSNVLISDILRNSPSMASVAEQTLERIYDNESIRELMEGMLKRLGIDFDGMHKHEDSMNIGESIYVIRHVYGRKKCAIPVALESSGTQRLIIITQIIAAALSAKNGVAIIDELDAFLHPDVFNEIIAMFASSLRNPNGAQLIFSTQSYVALSSLEKQQIHLAEKLDDGCTDVYRLDSVEGVRSDENFYIKYLAGEYGGVPKIQ